MDKNTLLVTIVSVVWLIILSTTFTGFVIHSNSCCIGNNCPEEEECNIYEAGPFSMTSTLLMIILLFSGIGFIYYKLKV